MMRVSEIAWIMPETHRRHVPPLARLADNVFGRFGPTADAVGLKVAPLRG